MSGAVAKRYARALFSLAVEGGTPSFEEVGAELARLAALFRDSGLATILGGGALDAKARGDLTERVVTEGGLSTTVGNFVRVLADNGRLGEMDAIEREYRRLVDRRLGRVRARVVSARTLDERVTRDVLQGRLPGLHAPDALIMIVDSTPRTSQNLCQSLSFPTAMIMALSLARTGCTNSHCGRSLKNR